MKFHFDRKVLIGFICTLLVLIALGVFSFLSIQRLINTMSLLTHGLSVINNGDLVLKSILELEAGERGYVISGDTSFMHNYRNAPRKLEYYLHKLDSLTAADTSQTARMDTLHLLLARNKSISDSILLLAVSDPDKSGEIISGFSSRDVSASLRKTIRNLQLTEQENFRRQNTVKGNSLQQFQLSIVALALACTVIIIYLFYVINRTLKAKNEAQEQLHKTSIAKQSSLEEELKEADYVYRSLASNIPGTAITVLDRDERYLMAEGDLLSTMGYDKTTMVGKKISETISSEGYAYYKTVIDRAFSGEVTLVERRTLSGIYTLMKVIPLRRINTTEVFAIMFVLVDVTPMKLAQIELEKANVDLEAKILQRTGQLNESNKQLEAFTYSVSHDLRAPLRAISGFSQILIEDYSNVLDSEALRITNHVINNAKRMGRLIDDLLDFSRVSRKEMSSGIVQVKNIVSEVIEETRIAYPNRNVTVEIQTLEPCVGDANLLRQVWVNLISNAFKYTGKKEHAHIRISSERKGEMVEYAIKDDGAGFDMQYSDKLFGVFQRLHKVSEFEGTGVGLALCRTIVLRHGGTIWAHSTVGEGSQFHFTIPAN